MTPLEYDGFIPVNYGHKNVMIQEWLQTIQAPTFRMNMSMICDNGFTGDSWPYEAVGFKSSWNINENNGYDDDIRLFSKDRTNDVSGNDPNFEKTFFTEVVKFALEDAQAIPIPAGKYLCSQCGRDVNWKWQTFALIWKYIYNSINIILSIYALLLFE
ncbi:hypothetical protein BGX27_011008 [Mortierella sp. AM989]|nr:hypothetical protein BGX27_011008 [Mortierella sp. AM989]